MSKRYTILDRTSPYYGATDTDERNVASGTENAAADIETLHAQELIGLAHKRAMAHINWFSTIKRYTLAYLKLLFDTWVNLAKTVLALLTGKCDLPVLLSYIFFTTAVSVVLFFGLIWCIIAHNPIMYSLYLVWSKMFGGGRGLVNALYDMFSSLTEEQAAAGKRALGASTLPYDNQKREFNLDAAKILLQFASLMYERSPAPTKDAAARTVQISAETKVTDTTNVFQTPDWLLQAFLGQEGAAEVSKILNDNDSDNSILEFTRSFHVEYRPVSELNTLSSAYCALFWDPSSNWIVVSFKGTSPTEFDEWVTDMNIVMKTASKWINGYSRVHGGFLDRVFPEVTKAGEMVPYDTIATGIRRLAAELLQKCGPEQKVNVWFTGHSLGCATAALAYSRSLCSETEFGERVILRDAYLFAAPVTCDIASSTVFNERMSNPKSIQRTMWRITNADDAVATALPDFGDMPRFRKIRKHSVADGDIFMFCHLGTEIKMVSKPKYCKVKGIQFQTGTKVSMCSSLDYKVVGTVKKGEGISKPLLLTQKIPLIGRFIQHATSFYWDQLMKVGVGNCETIKV